uniref:Polynucleotidyl transferase, Ribonuclease H fold n=1 Tax=Medicago truncatula TaxID=3880 RepID=A2Q1G1_MEDTR|nr:Polynucleotidyl transferase, Ribonuclease H fold [Medicago truncatula]
MGFKDLTAFNVAMLGKQGWQLQTNLESLVSKIFKARYYPNSSYLDARLGHNPSFVWRSILNAKVVVRQGARWKIGTGFNIPIISEPWIGVGSSIPPVGDDMLALQPFSIQFSDSSEAAKQWCQLSLIVCQVRRPNEDSYHILFHCPIAIDIWQTTNIWHLITPSLNQFDNAPDIIFNLLQRLSAAQIENIVTIMWSLWKARNLRLWQQVSDSTVTILERARHLLEGWRNVNRKQASIRQDNSSSIPSSSHHNGDTNVRWRRPTSGFGICIRDSDGNHVCSKIMFFSPTCSIDVGEALGLHHAIRWIHELQLTNVDFEVDSKRVADYFNNGWEMSPNLVQL